ncbi:MAG TPA: HAD family hydrolase [Thermomicrobiaceae bacterium]|nr:HAD family hydrolase [Thermomicrobiaceae bacterium]
MLPELLVTDCAGTVMRDEGTVLVAYRAALSAHDIPATDAELAARRGASKRAVFQELAGRAFPPERAATVAEHALADFEAALRDAYETGPVEEVPGAGDALARLRAAGVRLALTSGFERDVLDLLVARLGWRDLFDRTLAGSDVPLGRPAPFLIYRAMMDLGVADVARVAVVGDTPLDLAAGTHARAGWVIGVLGGAHGMETLGATPHTHLLASVAVLPALFGLS